MLSKKQGGGNGSTKSIWKGHTDGALHHTVTVITYVRAVALKGLLCVIVIINHSKFP